MSDPTLLDPILILPGVVAATAAGKFPKVADTVSTRVIDDSSAENWRKFAAILRSLETLRSRSLLF